MGRRLALFIDFQFSIFLLAAAAAAASIAVVPQKFPRCVAASFACNQAFSPARAMNEEKVVKFMQIAATIRTLSADTHTSEPERERKRRMLNEKKRISSMMGNWINNLFVM
jgi:hypothetical protein